MENSALIRDGTKVMCECCKVEYLWDNANPNKCTKAVWVWGAMEWRCNNE